MIPGNARPLVIRLAAPVLLAIPLTWAVLQRPERTIVVTAEPASTAPERAPVGQILLNAPLPAALLSPPAGPSPEPSATHQATGAKVRKFNLADLKAQVAVSPGGHFLLTVPELCHTSLDPQVQEVIAGHSVQTVAQVAPEPVNNADGHRLRISRLLISCCAQHAQTYSLPIDFGKPAPVITGAAWAKVTGTVIYRREGLTITPILQVTEFEPIPAPANSALY
jgi:hypothetical protein